MNKLIKFLLNLFFRSKNEPELSPDPPAIKYKNDSDRLKTEHEDLSTFNYNLYALLEDLRMYVFDEFGKTITITMIYRTDEEQEEIYKDNKRYQKEKFKSPHQFWQGVDLRSRTFTDEEIEVIENYLNSLYNEVNYYDWTAKNHTVGLGDHFHIQLLIE